MNVLAKDQKELSEAVHIELTRLNAALKEANDAGLKVELDVLHVSVYGGVERVQVSAEVFRALDVRLPEKPVEYGFRAWARKKFERAGMRVLVD